MRTSEIIVRIKDNLLYILAGIEMFVSAYRGSLLWVCAWGFLLIAESVALAVHRLLDNE